MAGRPTKLTQERHDKIVQVLRAGNYFDIACRVAGVAPGTGHKWRAWGEGRDVSGQPTPRQLAPYRAFHEACARAEAAAEAEAVAQLKMAGRDDWKAAESYLKRRYSARWQDRQHTTHEGNLDVGGPVVDALKAYGEVLDELAKGGEGDAEA